MKRISVQDAMNHPFFDGLKTELYFRKYVKEVHEASTKNHGLSPLSPSFNDPEANFLQNVSNLY